MWCKHHLKSLGLGAVLTLAGLGSVAADELALAAIPVGACEIPPSPRGTITAHALAMHGEPKYREDFTHFDYVNPQAPKGGEIRLGARGNFDSFNPFIPKGESGLSPTYFETLLTSSADEAFAAYGLVAERIEYPHDRSWVLFHLRPEAKWHDGKPITAHDVVWSLETLKSKGRPFFRFYYASVAKAEALGPRQVKFRFTEQGNRELPLIVGQLPILPKHYWEGREFEKVTLEPPLTSGPYRLGNFEQGRFVALERVPDYWGNDLPVRRGQNNFDRIRTEYFLDATVIREALKSGDIDYRAENQAKAWATNYNNVPAVLDGRLIKETIPHRQPTGMQALVFNTRREIFQHPKTRQALGYAFDFEWTNKNLFFGQYTRTQSFFSNTELASAGLPQGEELGILDAFRDRLPSSVFTETYVAPSTDGTGWPRDNLRAAFQLLDEAGWKVENFELVDKVSGEPLRFEILLYSPDFERVVLPFTRNLKRLGIDARIRVVDSAQYINRLRKFDFDMFLGGWGQSESPGNEQRGMWGTAAADSAAAQNYAGIKEPVVDELIELIISAPTRECLVARTRALDRVLLHGHYVIPNWHIRSQRLIYWNKFSRPQTTSKYGTSTTYWWYDEAKGNAIGSKIAQLRDSRQ